MMLHQIRAVASNRASSVQTENLANHTWKQHSTSHKSYRRANSKTVCHMSGSGPASSPSSDTHQIRLHQITSAASSRASPLPRILHVERTKRPHTSSNRAKYEALQQVLRIWSYKAKCHRRTRIFSQVLMRFQLGATSSPGTLPKRNTPEWRNTNTWQHIQEHKQVELDQLSTEGKRSSRESVTFYCSFATVHFFLFLFCLDFGVSF